MVFMVDLLGHKEIMRNSSEHRDHRGPGSALTRKGDDTFPESTVRGF